MYNRNVYVRGLPFKWKWPLIWASLNVKDRTIKEICLRLDISSTKSTKGKVIFQYTCSLTKPIQRLVLVWYPGLICHLKEFTFVLCLSCRLIAFQEEYSIDVFGWWFWSIRPNQTRAESPSLSSFFRIKNECWLSMCQCIEWFMVIHLKPMLLAREMEGKFVHNSVKH